MNIHQDFVRELHVSSTLLQAVTGGELFRQSYLQPSLALWDYSRHESAQQTP